MYTLMIWQCSALPYVHDYSKLPNNGHIGTYSGYFLYWGIMYAVLPANVDKLVIG